MDLHFRVLQNIDGVYLTEDTCRPEILETLTQDADRSSIFWLRYIDHRDRVIETEKKVWIQNFSVDLATGIGKTDFSYKLRMQEKPSYELCAWMKRDLFVELWESRPKLQEKRNEDTLEMYKEVVLNESNTPVIETRMRGVS